MNNFSSTPSISSAKNAKGISCHPNYARWFYVILILHVLLWTLVPTLLRHALPMDALEGFVWGQSWQLGYDRNPWLNAWLTHIAVALGGRSGLLVYFLSQLSVAACFLSLWRLGKKILTPLYALFAVLLLEGVQYYTLAAIDFNDNVLEIGLWALLTLCFYNALTEQKLRAWLLTGLWAALALMTKYYAAVLFTPMALILIFTPEGKESFKHTSFYAGLILFIAIITPHFIWLFQHDFVTFNYMLERASANGDWQNSAWYFAAIQLAAFSTPLFSLAWLWLLELRKKTASKSNTILGSKYAVAVSHFARIFLLAMGVLPLVLTILVAALGGVTLHVMWGTPLVSLWGLLLLALWPPTITCRRFYAFIIFTLLTFFSLLALYAYNIVYVGYQSSATYPAKEIAAYIDATWHQRYNASLPHYVVGDRYTAGNVAYFSKNKLEVCIWDYVHDDMSSRASRKLTKQSHQQNLKIFKNNSNENFCQSASTENVALEKLREQGAIFIWRADDNFFTVLKRIGKIKQDFPNAILLTAHRFSWIYHPDKPKLAIGAALLIPEATNL